MNETLQIMRYYESALETKRCCLKRGITREHTKESRRQNKNVSVIEHRNRKIKNSKGCLKRKRKTCVCINVEIGVRSFVFTSTLK